MALKIEYTASTWTERLAIGGLVVFSLLLAQLTMWKEDELFWLNVGGYPLWLRQSLQEIYYPYLFFVLATAAMLCRSVMGRFFRSLKFCRAWFLLVFALVIIFGSLALLCANNFINLIESRPLHYHSPIESSSFN